MNRLSLVLICTVFVAVFAGCKRPDNENSGNENQGNEHPDKKEIASFLKRYQKEVAGKLRADVLDLPQEQQSLMFIRAQSRDELQLLDDYVNSQPNLEFESLLHLTAARDAAKLSFEYLDELRKQKKFLLTEDEQKRSIELSLAPLKHLSQLAELVGYNETAND